MEDSLVDEFVWETWQYDEKFHKEIVVNSYLRAVKATQLFDDSADMLDLLKTMKAHFHRRDYVYELLEREILALKVNEGY